MADSTKKECPECTGKGAVSGTCTCDMEWRGNKIGDEQMEDCQCTPETPCSMCNGTGYVED